MADEKELFCTIARESREDFEEKRSIFIWRAKRVDSDEEAQEVVKAIKKEHRDATHNVWAYLMQGEIVARYSDDGEPQGTAGMPVLDVIRKSGVRNVCVVVTRYFGGTLLGAGGLVRAYSHAAALAIEAAGSVTYEPYVEYELRCGYAEYQKYSVLLANEQVCIDSTDFGADVCIRFAVKRSEAERVTRAIVEMGYGKDIPREVGERLDCR